MTRKLWIATPCYGGQVCVNYARSLFDLTTASVLCNIELEWHTTSHESLITRARNELVARFLADETAENFMFIDADIGFEAEDALRVALSPYDVAAGVYRLKGDDGGFAADPKEIDEIGQDGFARIRHAPTGFMRIKRSVFERLSRRYSIGIYKTKGGLERHDFFDTMICPETRTYLSEDYAFCRRCEAAGIPVYVDTTCKLEHMGTKRYTGDFLAAIRAEKDAQLLAAQGAQ